jgi:hypothetical protein
LSEGLLHACKDAEHFAVGACLKYCCEFRNIAAGFETAVHFEILLRISQLPGGNADENLAAFPGKMRGEYCQKISGENVL